MEKFPGNNTKEEKEILGQQFLEKYKKGNDSAFNTLYEIYEKDVINILKRNSIPPELIEDLKSDIFSKIADGIRNKQYEKREDATLTSWINTIAINRAMDYYRALKKERKNIPLNESMHQIPDDEYMSNIFTEERMELVMKQINKLPSDQNKLILMRLDGMSYEEIVNKTGMSLSAVKSILHRARETLKAYFSKK